MPETRTVPPNPCSTDYNYTVIDGVFYWTVRQTPWAKVDDSIETRTITLWNTLDDTYWQTKERRLTPVEQKLERVYCDV